MEEITVRCILLHYFSSISLYFLHKSAFYRKISMPKTQNLHQPPILFNQFKKCLPCLYLKNND